MRTAIVIVFILGLSLIIGTPILVVKMYHSNRLKRWQKHLISIGSIVGCILSLLASCAVLMVLLITDAVSDKDLTRSPRVARTYLKAVGIGIEFPKFSVDHHRFEFTGGDDTEEYWEIAFKAPLSTGFITRLDRLCGEYGSNWSIEKTDDNLPCYVFSSWDSKPGEYLERVVIYPSQGTARLSHYKF